MHRVMLLSVTTALCLIIESWGSFGYFVLYIAPIATLTGKIYEDFYYR
jgi:hypothetical protein